VRPDAESADPLLRTYIAHDLVSAGLREPLY
jgi:hypothetical protein